MDKPTRKIKYDRDIKSNMTATSGPVFRAAK
jgi:hypothetical protein